MTSPTLVLLAATTLTAVPTTNQPTAKPLVKSSAKTWLEARVQEAKALAERGIDPETPEEEKWRTDVKALLDSMIDWPGLTEGALGLEWKKRSNKEQQEFSKLLRSMVEASYQAKLKLAVQGKMKKPTEVSIKWLDNREEAPVEAAKDDEQTLAAQVRADKTDVVISFLVHRKENAWRVVDVSIDDVSTVRTYRSQFRKLIGQEGFPALLDRMRKKIADIEAGRADLTP